MHAAVARRSGVPSPSTRAAALLLASGVSVAVLAVLAFGLSMRVIQALREPPAQLRWIPMPAAEPPEPVPPVPKQKPTRAAAPAAAPAAPAQRLDRTILPLAPPAPLPPPAPVDGAARSGTTPGTGTSGTGSGGDGTGGDGGGATRRARAVEATWVVKPDLIRYYPWLALRGAVDGRVLLECRILRSQRVEDCKVLSATPRGYGFGQAALAASKSFRLNPPSYDGRVLEELRVKIPLDFNNIRRTR